MAGMPTNPGVPAPLAGPVDRLHRDLRDIFGDRLQALVAHGPRIRQAVTDPGRSVPINTLALVDRVSYKDLVACAERAGAWLAAGVAVPLLLPRAEFERSLDTFPLEYGDILAHHVLVAGTDPFGRLAIRDDDLRRACEGWGKSLLIQLREGFVEAGGEAKAVARLILASASPLAALLEHIARLRGLNEPGTEALAAAAEGIAGLPSAPVREVLALEARRQLDGDSAMALFPGYLDAVERLVEFLDGWTKAR
jgi:hypothetical protein